MKLLQLTPNLMVSNVSKSTQFYVDVFGFDIEYLIEQDNLEEMDVEIDTNKTYQYAGLRNNEFRLGLQNKKSIIEDVTEITSQNPGEISGNLYLEVENLSEVTKNLDKNNITYRKKDTTWYGMIEIYFTDPDGYIICAGQKDENFNM